MCTSVTITECVIRMYVRLWLPSYNRNSYYLECQIKDIETYRK